MQELRKNELWVGTNGARVRMRGEWNLYDPENAEMIQDRYYCGYPLHFDSCIDQFADYLEKMWETWMSRGWCYFVVGPGFPPPERLTSANYRDNYFPWLLRELRKDSPDQTWHLSLGENPWLPSATP